MHVAIEPLDGAEEAAKRLRGHAANGMNSVHVCVRDPDRADIIFLIEDQMDPAGEILRTNPIYRKYEEKCFVYSLIHRPSRIAPGLYVSMPKRYFDDDIHRAAGYFDVKNKYLPQYRSDSIKHNFSFMGNMFDVKLRQMLSWLHSTRNWSDTEEGYVEDTSRYQFFADRGGKIEDERQIDEMKRKYAEVMNESRFVLCPRGKSPSSFRMYETMLCGRVPVIISDPWVPPEGPDWDAFSIRIAENDIERIPEILNFYRDHWREMGQRAREAWENWFSPDVLFDRAVEQSLSLRRPDGRAPRLSKKQQLVSYIYRFEQSLEPTARRIGRGIRRRFDPRWPR